MGLVISSVELPLVTIYATTLALLQLFRPRKSFSGECHHPEEAAVIWDEEWDLDIVKPGTMTIIEGSTADGQSIYIEVVTHENYNSATIVFGDLEKIIGGQFTGAFIDNRTIKCGPLFIEMREPFRRWRVTFNGYLTGKDDEMTFVTMGGWWKPTSDARYFYSDLGLKGIKFNKNFDLHSNLIRLSRTHASEDLSQFGQFHAEVVVNHVAMEMRFRGIRQICSFVDIQSTEEFHVYMEDANRLSYKIVSSEGHSISVHHGYMDRANHKETSLSLPDEGSLALDNHRTIDFHPSLCSTLTGNLPYSLRKGEATSYFKFTSASGHEVELRRVKVNNVLTSGYALLRTSKESLTKIRHPEYHTFGDVTASACARTRLVVPFSLRSCQDKEFTGGKGANLAKLKSVENMFTVPNGAVITTTAFNYFLESNDHIRKLVKQLSTTGLPLEEYVMQGELISEAIKASKPPTNLIESLKDVGISEEKRYAVRSSAVGEDGSDLSSAGQLESILNTPFDEIPEKILECWSSNFRREVLTYRRNYGQIINPPMAVVIQEMLVDGAAGVMFTCDPVSNDDSLIVINAIKGCGEDIVSGKVTPDEISIKKKDRTISKPNNCCLSDEAINKLREVGVFLENIFGTSQDVEFIVKNDAVYLVQSRDVTGKERESRFELLTEFDGATLTDKEVYTTANVGEVVPHPMCPFEASSTTELFDRTMTNMVMRDMNGTKLGRHYLTAFFVHGQRLLFNIGEMFLRQAEIVKKDRLIEISIAGCPIFTDTMFEQGLLRYGPLPKSFLLRRLYIIINLIFFRSYKLIGEITEKLRQTEQLTPKGEATFENLMKTYNKQRLNYRQILEQHSDASVFSSFTYIVVGTLIRGSDQGETTPEMLSDLANIFSNSTSCVISADVPSALKKLAKAILDDDLRQDFLNADTNEAINVLKKKGIKSATQIDEFLRTHGHRGPKELYLRSEGWAEKPELLIVTLKTMLSSPLEEKISEEIPVDQLVDSLKCKPKGMRRWMIKYMVGQAHRGVACRESAKSCLVKSVYECRQTVKMMAKLLYNKGIIPDEDLMFFMHVDEIKKLYKTRSAKIIARAMRRRQIFAELEERQYAHVYHGNPDPLSKSSLEQMTTVSSLTGTVVCEGRVVAKARVATNLEEAKHTQPGEILITKCTDICWSPFFPIIKGIVTEIGGLLSHGAVVAREYGLPSLIAVEHATSVFTTGDLVELDTYKGTISKVVKEST